MDKFTEKVMLKLSTEPFSSEQLQTIEQTIVMSMVGFRIVEEETLPVLYNERLTEVGNYLCRKKIKGCSDLTIEGYKFVLKYFCDKVPKDFNNVTDTDVLIFLESFERERGCGKNRKNQVRVILNGSFRYLSDTGKISKNPMLAVEKIKYRENVREYLRKNEIVKMRESCKTLRERAIFEFFLATGCRVSEVVNCDISDVDFESMEVKVFGKGSKERITYLNATAKYYLLKYLENRTDDDMALFVTVRQPIRRIKKNQMEAIIKEIGKRCLKRTICCHIIRHTTATLLLNQGVTIDKIRLILGHEDLTTTQRYAKTSVKQIKNDYDKAFIL